jgi:hypothetical protein
MVAILVINERLYKMRYAPLFYAGGLTAVAAGLMAAYFHTGARANIAELFVALGIIVAAVGTFGIPPRISVKR